MNVRRFTARTSRDALILVRQALGEDAVVLSTKPSVGGVEVLAMAPEGMQQIERMAAGSEAIERQLPIEAIAPPAARAAAPVPAKAGARSKVRIEPVLEEPGDEVDADVAQLGMSTLSFQDYVRERMLRRRQAALAPTPPTEAPRIAIAADRASVLEQRMTAASGVPPSAYPSAAASSSPLREPPVLRNAVKVPERRMADMAVPNLGGVAVAPVAAVVMVDARSQPVSAAAPAATAATAASNANAAAATAAAAAAAAQASAAARRDQEDMMTELRSMKGLIEERFGALAFIEKLQRQPAQARLTQKLLDSGFSPALIRKIGDSLPADVVDEAGWAANVLERNLMTAEADASIEDQGGVYAMVGATGVGKTTTTAKIAAAFAAKYGASNLGLITLDAYRIGAHEQLRAYGRILGVPVHTAHDRASLEDLLDLLAAKKMVLIDTAGMAQRDARTRELLDMLSHRSIRKLLVINAASQGETIEDVMISYHASLCAGIVLSKMDEAVKLGPAIDALIRHKVKVIGVANGQRVPEDWHRLSANALVHRALRANGGTAYKLDASDVSLIFTAPLGAASLRRAAPVQSAHV